MSGQTSYADTPDIGFMGMIAEHFSNRQIDSGLAALPILAGAPVKDVAGSDDQYVTGTTTAAVTGVAVYEPNQEHESGDYSYPVNGQFPVMREGRLYVVAGGAILKGADVGYNPTTKKYSSTIGASTTLKVGKAHTKAAADGDVFIMAIDL
jgi:hypothetical protein